MVISGMNVPDCVPTVSRVSRRMAGTQRGPKTQITRVLTWTLACALLVGSLGVVYTATVAETPEDSFTEFYILGSDGSAADYPTNLTEGEAAEVTVGVVNNEHEQMTYRVVVRHEERTAAEQTIELSAGQQWESELSFTVTEPGRSRAEILLYRADEEVQSPYRELQMPITVRE